MGDPDALRYARRLYALARVDPAAAELLARVCDLHAALAGELAAAEARHVAAARQAQGVTGSRDPDAHTVALATTLAARAGRWRAARKDRLQALRRLVGAYETKLGLRAPPPPRKGRWVGRRQAVQSVDETGRRQVEQPGDEL